MKVVSITAPLAQGSQFGKSTVWAEADGVPCLTIAHERGWYIDGSIRWLWIDALVPDDYLSIVLQSGELGASLGIPVSPVDKIDTSLYTPYVIDSVSGRCDLTIDSETVEQQDALRTVTLVEGRHMAGATEISRARIRYERTRKSDVVYITHQWICSADDVSLTEIGIDCPASSVVVIKDMSRSEPAMVSGTTAKLWTGGVLDYKHATLIDDGIWAADYVAAQIAVGLTEAEMRATVSQASGTARTHRIGVGTALDLPSWPAPLRPPPEWIRDQRDDVVGAVFGESALADQVVAAYLDELDAHDAYIPDVQTGWYHDGHPPHMTHTSTGARGVPKMFRGHNVVSYDIAYYLGLTWLRGYDRAWERFDRYSRGLLDYYITWSGDLAGTWIGGDEAQMPDYWAYQRTGWGAEGRVVPPTEIGRPEMALLMRWWLMGDRFALDAIEASAAAFERYFSVAPIWRPYPNTPPGPDDYIYTHQHTLGHHNRLTHITRYAVLAQALRDKAAEIEDLTRLLYDTFRDPIGPLGLREQVWIDGPFSWATIRYKIQGKIRDLLDLYDTFGWSDALAGAVDSIGYHFTSDISTWRIRVDDYQPLDAFILERLYPHHVPAQGLIDEWLGLDAAEWAYRVSARATDLPPLVRWQTYHVRGWVAADGEYSARLPSCAGHLISVAACV